MANSRWGKSISDLYRAKIRLGLFKAVYSKSDLLFCRTYCKQPSFTLKQYNGLIHDTYSKDKVSREATKLLQM